MAWASSFPSSNVTPTGRLGAVTTAAEAIARGPVSFTFPELDFALSPLFKRPEDRLEVFLRLPACMQQAAWDALPRELG